MTKFEQMLLDKGYIKFILDCKTMKYKIPKYHSLSTMVNIAHRYFHKSNVNILQKIALGKSTKDLNLEDRKEEIVFGLNEVGKPPTLIYPHPNIKRKLVIDGEDVYVYRTLNDDMSIVLQNINHEEILKAMYDRNICLELN